MRHTLFPYQVETRDFLRAGGSLNADQQGLGKTLTLLDVMRLSDDYRPSLIVCPAVALGVWEREGARHGFRVRVVARPRDSLREADVYVVSIDALRNAALHAALMEQEFAHLGIDEAHYAKNPDAQRTARLLELADRTRDGAGRVIPMTGTPTPNHIGELWPLIRATDHGRIDEISYAKFTRLYCRFKIRRVGNGRYRRNVEVIAGNNPRTVPDLMRKLDGWWIRHKKEDVLKDLPAKLRRVVPLAGAELSLLDEFEKTVEGRALMGALRANDFTILDDHPSDLSLARLRRLLALSKVQPTVDYVRSLQDHHPKLLVWGWHTAALRGVDAALRAAGLDTVYGDGSTSHEARKALERRVQDDPRPVVGVLQLQAMGTAITLTEADRALMMESAPTPGVNEQAEDRIHRLGQTRGVLIDYLAVRDSPDEAIMGVAARKAAEWEEAEAAGQEFAKLRMEGTPS